MEEILLYNGTVKIYFEEVNRFGKKVHEYRDEAGNKLTSVTAITGLLDKSGPLTWWATDLMGKYLFDKYNGQPVNQDILQEAKVKYREAKQEGADIGTAIHDYAEQTIKGLNPEIPTDQKVRNGAMAFLKWMKTHDIKFEATERIVYSKKYNYVGKCDWYGKIGNIWIIGDHKSSKGIYNEMRYQLAGYWNALEEEGVAKFEQGLIVKYGKEDGEFEVKEISHKEYLKDRKAFLGLLATKQREAELAKNGKKY